MHDHNEGSIPHLLKAFFGLCFKSRLFSIDQLNFMFQFHDYGWLNQKNRPSQIHVSEKRSLGQNASQSICIFRNLPFVLFRFKDSPELSEMWKCIQYLLQILTIVYSYDVSEHDLSRLDIITNQFLDQFRKCVNEPLIPKLHFMLHYSSIIRRVGPVMYMNTIRYEAMHQIFKRIARKTKIFRNINKTMARRHQQQMCMQGFSVHAEASSTKGKKIHPDTFKKHQEILMKFCEHPEQLLEIDILRFNSFEFQKNILVIQNGFLYAIRNIFQSKKEYHLLTKQYEILSFDSFLNSFRVQENSHSMFTLIHFDDLKNKKPFENKVMNGEEFVIEENLEIRKLCHLNYFKEIFLNKNSVIRKSFQEVLKARQT